jgi:PAS domain-containing protein
MALETADAHSLLLHSIGEGVFAIDLEGRCTFVNPAALRLLRAPIPVHHGLWL